jgi:hypothetical protein
VLAFLVMPMPSTSVGVAAQVPDSRAAPPTPEEEAGLLRRASSLEWQGDLDGAERILTDLLTRSPASSGALFSLERILRARDEVERVLPWADRFLGAEPTAAGPRYMKLRVLAEVDSLAGLRSEAARWFEAEPRSPAPYREVARLYGRAMGPAAALEVIEEGRWALKRPALLAVEAGDLRLAMGDPEGAVAEWRLALEDPDADVDAVVRRVLRLDSPGALAEPVLQALGADEAPAEWHLAGVGLAIRTGLDDGAREAARRGVEALPVRERSGFLREVARLADAGDMAPLSLWALRTLREAGADAPRDLPGEARLAATALSAGDTAAAVSAQRRLVRGLPSGSVERRRALGDLIRVESAWSAAPTGTLRTRLEAFQLEYPDAPELDVLVARTARGMTARGAASEALALLAEAPGPRSRVARAWIHMERGETEAGREALSAALPGLDADEATGIIRFLAALERVGPASGDALARAVATGEMQSPAAAIEPLETAVGGAPPEDRAPLRLHLARIALAAGDSARAEASLAALAREAPDAPEAPEAILVQARILAARPEGRAAARSLLTELILARPEAAVVPAARRELERLEREAGR